MATLKVLPDNPPEAIRQTRREARCTVLLPMRLISGSGEAIPAVLINISASGLLALVDIRFSPVLPPPPGAHLESEFFLDDIEIRQAVLEVIRVEQRGESLFGLSCKFVHPSSELSTRIRAKVAAYLAAARPQRSSPDN